MVLVMVTLAARSSLASQNSIEWEFKIGRFLFVYSYPLISSGKYVAFCRWKQKKLSNGKVLDIKVANTSVRWIKTPYRERLCYFCRTFESKYSECGRGYIMQWLLRYCQQRSKAYFWGIRFSLRYWADWVIKLVF